MSERGGADSGKQGGGRVDQGADDFGVGHGGGLQGLVVVEHPSGEQGFGGFLDPLVDEDGNFLAQVGGMVEPREFKALQGGARGRLQIVEGRSKPEIWSWPKLQSKGWGRKGRP